MENIIQVTLSRLRDEFIARLPDRVTALETLLDRVSRGEGVLDHLHRETHSLVGVTGTYRLMQVFEAAQELERIVSAVSEDKGPTESELLDMREALARIVTKSHQPRYSVVPPPPLRKNLKHIVIVEDDQEQAGWTRSVLEQADYQVTVFNELEAFREACQNQEMPAAVIMDMVFPEGEEAGARIVSEMKEKCLNGLPVIFLSVRHDLAAKLAAYRSGATRYLTKPVEPATLVKTIIESVALRPSEPFRVLVVDDDPDVLAMHALLLHQAGMEVRETFDPLLVPQMLDGFEAEVLLLDMYMPQCSGPEIAAILRDDARYAKIPVIYLSAETDISRQLLALDRAGDHFLTKPVETAHLIAAVAMHAKRYRYDKEKTEILRSTLYERERQQVALDAHAIVSATDVTGNIIYVNDKFCEVSGYGREELIGRNHRIIKSDLHPSELYADMWRTIKKGQIWHGEICNKRKNGDLYWVDTSIVPFLNPDGQPYQYISMRTDITELKKHEEELLKNEKQMRMVLDNAADAVFIAGKNERWTYVNDRAVSMLGYGREALLNMSIYNIVPTDWRATYQQKFHEELLVDGKMHREVRFIKQDGSKLAIEMNAAVLPDGNVYVSCRDISARKQAEIVLVDAAERVRESEQRLNRAQQVAQLGSFVWNLVSGELKWSDEHYRLWGLEPDSVAPSFEIFSQNIDPDDLVALNAALEHAMASKETFDFAYRFNKPGGSERMMHSLGEFVFDDAGKAVSMIGTVQDVSERKQAEQALKTSSSRLEAAQKQAHVGNWEVNVITGKSYWSDETFRILGHDPAHLIPTMKDFFATVHPDDVGILQEGQGRAAETGVFDVVHRIIRPDGEVRYVHEIADGQFNAEGRLERLIGTSQDITDQKYAERELIEAKEFAESASRAKSEFLASMSHELRTPLNAILGFSQLFVMDTKLPQDTRNNAREIERAGQHLLSLVNDIIDLARIESGKLELSIEPVPVVEVIKDSVAMVASLAVAHHVELIESDCSAGEIMVRADYVRLRQVVINLLSNAIKYNKVRGRVNTLCRVNEDSVRISVADTGVGIAADMQSRLFSSFDRLGEERGIIEGTGIGLVISKSIVEAMGGSIGFESLLGQGSIFWIDLPLIDAQDKPYSKVMPEPVETVSVKIRQTNRLSVMYIEDNPMNMRLMKQIFASKTNLELRDAHSAEIGLELAFSDPPDLILMDVNLPGMDGYRALEILKADARTAHIPVIAISANAMMGDRERGLAAGFADYLTKPLDVDKFYVVLENLLGKGVT